MEKSLIARLEQWQIVIDSQIERRSEAVLLREAIEAVKAPKREQGEIPLHKMEIGFTCEQTGARWRFKGLTQLIEAFLRVTTQQKREMVAGWQPISKFEGGYENENKYWFWLVIHEDFSGEYGQPFMPKEPHAEACKYGGWASTMEATHFMPYYEPKSPEIEGQS
jgi:hypothetical protein